MEGKQKNRKGLKIFISILFAVIVFATFGYVLFEGDLTYEISNLTFTNILAFACVLVCFLFSLFCIEKSAKKILITLALLLTVVSDIFVVLLPGVVEDYVWISLGLLCGVQFVYLVYTLTFCKGAGRKIINVAFRVALCLLAYFILPEFVELDTMQMISLMCFINTFVNLIILLFNIKTEWLLLLGLLLLFAVQAVTMLSNGWLDILQITNTDFTTFLSEYDLAFYLYIPSQFVIALSSIWAVKRKRK